MLRIDNSSKNAKVTVDRLDQFFIQWKAAQGKRVELMLDEVDEVFHLKTFQALGEIAKNGQCRLLLGGKGNLLSTMVSSKSPLACRLDLIRLEPLAHDEAKQLLFLPLGDLGFQIEEAGVVWDRVTKLTGNLPHLLQYYGRRLCETLLDRRCGTLLPEHVDYVRDEFESYTYFTAALHDLPSAKAQLLALILLRNGTPRWNLGSAKAAASGGGLSISTDELWSLCNDLVISNILCWSHGGFQLANEALIYYARQSGYLDGALRDAQATLNGAQKR